MSIELSCEHSSDVNRAISRIISMARESRHTGKIVVVCELQMVSGGITEAYIERVSHRGKIPLTKSEKVGGVSLPAGQRVGEKR